MLTSESAPAVLAELGSETGALALTNDPAPDLAVEGLVVGTDTGTFPSNGEPVPVETIPLGEPWLTDAGATTLTSVPLGWVPSDWVPLDDPWSTDAGASTLTSVPLGWVPPDGVPLDEPWFTEVGATTFTSGPVPVVPVPVVPVPVVPVPVPVEPVVAEPVPVRPVPDGAPDAVTGVPVAGVPVAGVLTPDHWLADAATGAPDPVTPDGTGEVPVLVPDPVDPATHALVGALVDAAGFADARKSPKRTPPNPKMPNAKKRRSSVNISSFSISSG